jgi:probable blue pigment (indigoidine) exporter
MEANIRWGLVTAIAPIAWGSNYFVTKQFLPPDYPLYGAVLRALPAGLILLMITRERPHGSWWWKSLVLGALNVGAFFALIYVAAQLLASGVASTLMSTSPAVMMLLAWPMIAERPRMLSLAGAAVGFGGVCVMLLDPGNGVDPLGVAASLAAMTLSSIGYILAKRWGGSAKVLPLTAWQLVAGGLLLVPVAVIVEGTPPVLDAPAIIGFGYVTLIATALAFAAWFAGLRHLSAGNVGLIGLLNPVTGVLLGTLIAGESFGWNRAIGMLLVLVGILLGQPAAMKVLSRRLPDRRGISARPTAGFDIVDECANSR